VSPPPAISQPIRPLPGNSSRRVAHQLAPLSPRSSISLRRLSIAPVASGSGLQMGFGPFSPVPGPSPVLTPTPLNPRISSSSDLSVSSLLSSLSSDVGSRASLAYSNLPMVNDNDFYAVITGVEPGVWQGRYVCCLYTVLGLICAV